MSIKASELILNEDGSVYHLNLKPEHLAPTVITVGDPDRVDHVTRYFDQVEFQTRKREFHTQTGTFQNHRITVISTGIGTDNIDIVFNELDALVNVDLDQRKVKDQLTSLDIIRVGTSGSIQGHIPINSFVASRYAVGFDSLLHFYDSAHVQDAELAQQLVEHTGWSNLKSRPYVVKGDDELYKKFASDQVVEGFTATNVGFYGPQGRVLRLPLQDDKLNDKLASFNADKMPITNLEMETSGIYGLAALLGHRALSLNAIVANRATGEFSKESKVLVDRLIKYTLERIIEKQ